MNVAMLIGRMVAQPELKYTSNSNVAVCSFRIAVNRRFKSQNGENEADFIDIVAWRQSAEFVANYCGKGRLIAVQGSIQTRSWVAQDGTKRRTVEIVADNVQLLDRPREKEETVAPTIAPPDPFDVTNGVPDWNDSNSNNTPYSANTNNKVNDLEYDPFSEE